MRTVCFVERLEFECPGNVVSKAVKVGDVDNDQGFELVVGNTLGDLFIHKGTATKPWRQANELGMITCLDIGNVCNHGINYLVVSTLEGWCYVFAVTPDSINNDGSSELPEEYRVIKPAFRQNLSANSKSILIADIDGDGNNELIVGYSDRRVQSFRWQDFGEGHGHTIQGDFVALETWQLAGQLGSLTVNKRQNGSVDLMVSQPGGTFVTLLDKNDTKRLAQERTEMGTTDQAESGDKEEESGKREPEWRTGIEMGLYEGPSLVYHPLGNARARNPGVTTEVVGNISRRKKDEEKYVPSYCAICTLDGTLTLVDDDKILWSLYVDHQLFTITKVDITGDGTEEVVACSWDGRTYIVNLSRDVVRFNFHEHVAAFCAGYYSIPGEGNVPCLIYVTFSNRIVVYYHVNMPQIGIKGLMDTMVEQEGTDDLLACFNVDTNNTDELRELYHWCLYGRHHAPTT